MPDSAPMEAGAPGTHRRAPAAKPTVFGCKPIVGRSEECPQCHGLPNRTIRCKFCDMRGVVTACESCAGTGLVTAEGAVYGVVACLCCNSTGYRPARFEACDGTVVPSKFCRMCGVTGAHRLLFMGSLCAACNRTVLA